MWSGICWGRWPRRQGNIARDREPYNSTQTCFWQGRACRPDELRSKEPAEKNGERSPFERPVGRPRSSFSEATLT